MNPRMNRFFDRDGQLISSLRNVLHLPAVGRAVWSSIVSDEARGFALKYLIEPDVFGTRRIHAFL